MPPESTSPGNPGCPIGVVSRLTGIHPETLRMRERRYGLVSPARSSDGNRLYSHQDVRRLTLVKALTDAGHPVGSVALLPVDALESLLGASGAPAGGVGPAAPDAPCHVAVVGAGLSARVAHEAAAMPLLELVGTYGRIEDLGRQAPAQVHRRILFRDDTKSKVPCGEGDCSEASSSKAPSTFTSLCHSSSCNNFANMLNSFGH